MNILVADRSEYQRNGLKWMLENSDFQIEQYSEVSTVEDFFQAVEKEKYQLIIIDVDMLAEEDWESLTAISLTSRTIGTTEKKDFDIVVRCLELGFLRLFVKPFSIQSLMAALKTFFERSQEQDMNKTILKTDKVKEQWVNGLITGQVTNLKEVWNQATLLGYQMLPSVVILCQISQFNELMKNKSDLWKKQVLNNVYENIAAFCQENELISSNQNDEFVLLYTPKKGEQKQETIQNVKKIGYKLYEWVQKKSNYSLLIACGSEYKNPMHLYHSYHEAKRLIELQFYYDYGKVCHYLDYPHLLNTNIMDEIGVPIKADDLTNDNLPLLLVDIENKLNQMKEKGILPLYYKITLMYILIKLASSFIKNEKELFTAFLKHSEKIIESESMNELLPQIKEFLAENTYVHSLSLRHIVIEKALEFIHTNYTQSITLEQVAEYVDRSPYYLSHLFKKEMNMTFVEYLTNLRIKKAKELLTEEDLTISEIASLVGYQDPNYFSRVFKAISGDSPKQWKTQKYLERTKN